MIAKKITGNKEHPELDFQRDHTWIKSSQIFFKRLLSGSLAWCRGLEKSHTKRTHGWDGPLRLSKPKPWQGGWRGRAQ